VFSETESNVRAILAEFDELTSSDCSEMIVCRFCKSKDLRSGITGLKFFVLSLTVV
jgi:hypothetical protein